MPRLASLFGILRREKKRVGKLGWHRNLMRDTRPFTFASMCMRYFRRFNFNKIHNGRWRMRPSKNHSWYNNLSFLVIYDNLFLWLELEADNGGRCKEAT